MKIKIALLAVILSQNPLAWSAVNTRAASPAAPKMALASLATICRRPLAPSLNAQQYAQLSLETRRLYINNTLQYVKEITRFNSARPFTASKSQSEIRELRQIRLNLKWLQSYLRDYATPSDNAILEDSMAQAVDKVSEIQIAQELHFSKIAKALDQTRIEDAAVKTPEETASAANEKLARSYLKELREEDSTDWRARASIGGGKIDHLEHQLKPMENAPERLSRLIARGLIETISYKEKSIGFGNSAIELVEKIGQKTPYENVQKIIIKDIANKKFSWKSGKYSSFSRMDEYSLILLKLAAGIAVESPSRQVKDSALRLLQRERGRIEATALPYNRTSLFNDVSRLIISVEQSRLESKPKTVPTPSATASRNGKIMALYNMGESNGYGVIGDSSGNQYVFRLDAVVGYAGGDPAELGLDPKLPRLSVKFALTGNKITRVELPTKEAEKIVSRGEDPLSFLIKSFLAPAFLIQELLSSADTNYNGAMVRFLGVFGAATALGVYYPWFWGVWFIAGFGLMLREASLLSPKK